MAEIAEVSFKQKQEKYVGHIAKSEGGGALAAYCAVQCSLKMFISQNNGI